MYRVGQKVTLFIRPIAIALSTANQLSPSC